MIDDYYAALKTRVEAEPGFTGRVYDTVRLDANGALIRDNYVIQYSPVPVDVPEYRYTGLESFAGAVEFDNDFRVVGLNAATVRQMTGRLVEHLVGHKLAITGRAPAAIRLGEVGKTVPDTSVKPFLYYADVSIEWTSRP